MSTEETMSDSCSLNGVLLSSLKCGIIDTLDQGGRVEEIGKDWFR